MILTYQFETCVGLQFSHEISHELNENLIFLFIFHSSLSFDADKMTI
jgi:hypothetical protein